MKAKLGFREGLDDDVTSPLVDELVALLQESRADYTRFSGISAKPPAARRNQPGATFWTWQRFDAWAKALAGLGPDADAMDGVNPVYIPRNHLVEEALAAATAGTRVRWNG